MDDQVSTLKKDLFSHGAAPETGLGIRSGSFVWNAVEEQTKINDTSRHATNGEIRTPQVDDASSAYYDVQASTSGRRFELRDINVMFPEDKLTVVTGPTASGKTALLMALLGEMTTLEGEIVMSKNPFSVDEHGLSRTISYAAQSPWLRHRSIRDNILFGYPYDEARYQQVLECCALKPDLEVLEDGDATEIGARWVYC